MFLFLKSVALDSIIHQEIKKPQGKPLRFLRSKPLKMVEAAGKRGIKQLIIVFDDAPEENKETAEPKACEGDRRRLYFRAVGEPWFESCKIKTRLS